jgi:hypothetical protein
MKWRTQQAIDQHGSLAGCVVTHEPADFRYWRSDPGQVQPDTPTKLSVTADRNRFDPVAIPSLLQQPIDFFRGLLDRRRIIIVIIRAQGTTGRGTTNKQQNKTRSQHRRATKSAHGSQ